MCWEYAEPCNSCTDTDGEPTNWKPQTNADRIRAMTDEKLAEEIAWIIVEAIDQCFPKVAWKIDRDSRISGTAKDMIEWLRQEATQEATDEDVPMEYLEAGGTL